MNENIEYEILTKEIYEALLKEEGHNGIVNVQHDIKKVGKSGCEHQIDVYWEYKMGGITHKIAIECKNYKSKVSIGKIRDFKSVIDDIGANGIFVSREGYQSGAKDFAKFNGIELRELRFPNLNDWEGLVREVHLKINARHTKIKERTPILDKDWIKENLNYKDGEPLLNFRGNQKEFIIYDSLGNELTNLYEIENQLETFEETKLGLEFTHEFSNCYIKSNEGSLLKIKSFKFKYDSFNSVMNSVFNAEKFVKAILKEVETGEIKFFNKE